MIRLYKDGNCMGIVTDEENEEAFRESFCQALESLIEGKIFCQDWEFQLYRWLENYADICDFYRHRPEERYHARVMVKKLFQAGSIPASDQHKSLIYDSEEGLVLGISKPG